jgi:beta-glucuronidase
MARLPIDRLRKADTCRSAQHPACPWTEDYQAEVLDVYHRVFDRVDAVVGEQVWTFADFATMPGVFRVDGNKKGIFTRDRRPKTAAFHLRARWRQGG